MFYNSYDNIGLIKVLSFLKSHNTEYLSGQDLSDVLKISRVAVWKHIKTIKELGYRIETKHKLGYKLTQNTKKLLPWEVITGIQTKQIGKKAYYFNEIDSTQNFAIKLAESNNENGSVIIAEKQTHGKGRLQRKWESPNGGMWFSIVLKPKLTNTTLSLIPIAVSVALAESIKKTTKIEAKVKWPNDILVKTKKIAGIIIDASIESNHLEYIIIGVGINFGIDIKKISKQLEKTPNFYGITSIKEHNNKTEQLEIIQSFFKELEQNILELEKNKTENIIKNWTKKSATIGKTVTTAVNGKKIKGVAIKISKEGALIIKTPKKLEKVLAEDITHLR